MEERAAEGGLVTPGLQAAGGRRRCRRRILHERPGTSGSTATELLPRLEVRGTGTLLFNDVFTNSNILSHTWSLKLGLLYDLHCLRAKINLAHSSLERPHCPVQATASSVGSGAGGSGGSQYNGGPTLEDRVRWAQMAEQRVNTAASISQNIYAVRRERPEYKAVCLLVAKKTFYSEQSTQ